MKLFSGGREMSRGNLVAALLATLLLVVFAFSVGDYFARPPSTKMSRELELAELAWQYGITLRPQVVTVPLPDDSGATIIAADGTATNVLQIDVNGTVLNQTTLDLDLSRSSNLASFHTGNDSLVLFSGRNELQRTHIDLPSRSTSRRVVVPNSLSFCGAARYIAVETEGRLLVLDAESGDLPTTVHDGQVLDYAIGASAGQVAIATITGSQTSRFSVNLHRFTRNLEPEAVLTLLDNTVEDAYRRLEAIQIQNGLVDLLFSVRDTRYGKIYLNVLRVSGETGATVDEWSINVPLMNSRYDFVDGDRVSSTFVMRFRTAYGSNLVTCTMSEGSPPLIEELTKTMPLSDYSSLFRLAGRNALVFSDIQGERRTIYYASDDPEVIRQASRWTLSTVLRALFATLGGGALALVAGGICLLITGIAPYFAAAGAQRLLRRRAGGNRIAFGVGVLAYLGLKIALSHFILRRTAGSGSVLQLVESTPIIYLAVVFMTGVATVLVVPQLRPGPSGSPQAPGAFARFAIIDTTLYSFLFLIYPVTGLFVAKL